ncbi:hypothetical protein [Limnospira fusiformis]|uniref:Uncharacterized protein n=2 Tax=Limnospira TaxID=2596745 RepID=A0A9P1KDC2_9CYAN|nr:conserved hypothetical protein [Limnospira indica PCC 8005]
MDMLTEQVMTLTNKVDALYEVVMQLRRNIPRDDHGFSEMFSLTRTAEEGLTDSSVVMEESELHDRKYNSGLYPVPSPAMTVRFEERQGTHKDILSDDHYINSSTMVSQETMFSADVQIQRLTAQLTAAYNRIAALEEQLLSRRVRA